MFPFLSSKPLLTCTDHHSLVVVFFIFFIIDQRCWFDRYRFDLLTLDFADGIFCSIVEVQQMEIFVGQFSFAARLTQQERTKRSLTELRVQLSRSVSTMSKRFIEEDHFLLCRRWIELKFSNGHRERDWQRCVSEQFDQIEKTRLTKNDVDRRVFRKNRQKIGIVNEILDRLLRWTWRKKRDRVLTVRR